MREPQTSYPCQRRERLYQRRTFVPIRESALDAHRWWVLGGRIGQGRLRYASVDLRCVWLAAAELSGLILHDAAIDGASFELSRFDGADLQDCNGANVDFRHTSLRGAVIEDCELADSRFERADLS